MRKIHIEYHNHLELSAINRFAREDPAGFVARSEAVYDKNIAHAVEIIKKRMKFSRVVMLAGPSSSGKTTTSHRLTRELGKEGIHAVTISMDDYFKTMDRYDESIDYEAPERLDLELLCSHIARLDAGEEIGIPVFDFLTAIQTREVKKLRLGRGEIAIFEGIHALSDTFCSIGDPTGIYISARMRVIKDDKIFVPPEWLRFIRRCVRDELFRNSSFSRTLGLWKNVRRGELRYILPMKENAHIQIDTSLPYEPCLFAPLAAREMAELPQRELRERDLLGIAQALSEFVPIPRELIPPDSLMREFIGQ